MDIEEYRSEPRPLAPEPKRKDLSVAAMTLFAVAVFLTTLAVLNRHDIAGYARQFIANNPPPASVSMTQGQSGPEMRRPDEIHESIAKAVPALPTVARMAQCLSGKVLSAEERAQVTQALEDDVSGYSPPLTPALNAGIDLQRITFQQAAEFTNMLTHIDGQLGARAQRAFQEGLTGGACKLVPSSPASLPAPVWPGQT